MNPQVITLNFDSERAWYKCPACGRVFPYTLWDKCVWCCEGTPEVMWLSDDWTVITEDLKLSAHYENTILITKGKPEILTLTEDEKAAGLLDWF